jgi:ribosomal protein L11 methyltransferase
MNNHVKISFHNLRQEQKDLLVAHLSNMEFDGFEEGQSFLIGYCSMDKFVENDLIELAGSLAVSFDKEILKQQNWNDQWEKNFQPVQVDDFCAIRASFHPAREGVKHDIIITPKMSFGTGHHATTYMMILFMKNVAHTGKSVLDFGTGTGLLAILSEKLGAASVFAIDNDDWSIENAAENILLNDCHRIMLQKADTLAFTQQFDIILANINKNVLLANMEIIQQHLAGGGVLIISGLLENDRQGIEELANKHKLKVTEQLTNNGWIALQLAHY